jgi:hypothetical protein
VAKTRTHTQAHTEVRQDISIRYDWVDSPIRIVLSGTPPFEDTSQTAVYEVDASCRMTFTTREYIAALVVTALKLGACFNSLYTTPHLSRIKRAVEELAKTVDPDVLHAILGAVQPTGSYTGDQSGELLLAGWNSDPDWLILKAV